MYKIIGSEKIKDYQVTLIAMGVLLFILLGTFYLFDNNGYNLIILLLSVAFFLNFSVIYSKLYMLEFNGELFKFSNLYRTKGEKYTDLKDISIVLRMPFVFSLKFNDGGKYFFMLNSKNNLLSFIEAKETALKRIKQQIDEVRELHSAEDL